MVHGTSVTCICVMNNDETPRRKIKWRIYFEEIERQNEKLSKFVRFYSLWAHTCIYECGKVG